MLDSHFDLHYFYSSIRMINNFYDIICLSDASACDLISIDILRLVLVYGSFLYFAMIKPPIS